MRWGLAHNLGGRGGSGYAVTTDMGIFGGGKAARPVGFRLGGRGLAARDPGGSALDPAGDRGNGSVTPATTPEVRGSGFDPSTRGSKLPD